MSNVTNIVLQTYHETHGVSLVQDVFRHLNKNGLEELPIDAGGGKRLEVQLHAGAYNNFSDDNVEKLVQLFYLVAWDDPNKVVLIITPQDGEVAIHVPK